MPDWQEARILITVKTYPVPSAKYGELVCCAGVRESAGFIRLFPIPFRLLDRYQQFGKYTWLRVQVRKSSDPRFESYRPDLDQLVIEGEVPPAHNWAERRRLLAPLISPSIECLSWCQRQANISLGLVRPREITRFYIRPSTEPGWSQRDLANLQRASFFQQHQEYQLQKIPVEFHYEFHCDDPDCNGHDMQCLDWEIGEAYRSWRRRYTNPSDFEATFHQRFGEQMMKLNDTHFFVGTLAGHPQTWTIIGLFYPRRGPG